MRTVYQLRWVWYSTIPIGNFDLINLYKTTVLFNCRTIQNNEMNK